jgi:hypothetical protein
MEVVGQFNAPAALPLGKQLSIPVEEKSFLGPRAGLNTVEKKNHLFMPGVELRFSGRPAVARRYTDREIACLMHKHTSETLGVSIVMVRDV